MCDCEGRKRCTQALERVHLQCFKIRSNVQIKIKTTREMCLWIRFLWSKPTNSALSAWTLPSAVPRGSSFLQLAKGRQKRGRIDYTTAFPELLQVRMPAELQTLAYPEIPVSQNEALATQKSRFQAIHTVLFCCLFELELSSCQTRCHKPYLQTNVKVLWWQCFCCKFDNVFNNIGLNSGTTRQNVFDTHFVANLLLFWVTRLKLSVWSNLTIEWSIVELQRVII